MHLLVRGGATRANSVLAARGREVAVFDTGMGHTGQTLLRALADRGIAPNDVTLVFNTHAHVDHSHNNVLFPRAEVLCSKRDRAWTRSVHEVLAREERPGPEHITAFYAEVATGRYNPKLIRKVLGIEKLLWDPARLGPDSQAHWLEEGSLPPGVTAIETPGHSPYHVSFVIETGRSPVLVCGDALLLHGEESYDAPMMPNWSSEQYAASRTRLQRFHGIIVPGHDVPFTNP